MTWLDLVKRFDPSISNEAIEYILWNETSFPMGGIRMIVYQIRSALRARKNNIRRCEMCGYKIPFHDKGCIVP